MTSNSFVMNQNKIFLSDIAGYKEEKEEAVKIINVIKNYASLSKLGITIPKGLILAGPSGVGKTMLAKAIAAESNVPFYEFESSDESNSDSSINSLKELFQIAKSNSPSIVFIDELDELICNNDYESDYSRKALKTLLTEIDGANSSDGVLVIATTNHIQKINPALLRSGRLDKHIEFNMPDFSSRKEITDLYLNKIDSLHNIDAEQIARRTPGFSCADIKSLINETLLCNVEKGIENITNKDFYEIIPTIGVKGTRKNVNEEPSDIICAHEVGHFIVNYALKQNVGCLSVIQTGNIRGMMTPTENYSPIPRIIIHGNSHQPLKGTRQDCINEICVSLAGCKAEEYFLHEYTCGSRNDINQATCIIENMIRGGAFGVKEAILESLDGSEDAPKREMEIISTLVDECENKIQMVFEEYENLIRILIKELKERKKLDAGEAEDILNEYFSKS